MTPREQAEQLLEEWRQDEMPGTPDELLIQRIAAALDAQPAKGVHDCYKVKTGIATAIRGYP